MATLRRDGVGRYFVSMAMGEDILPLPVADRAVGVDAGLSAAVTLDDGTKVAPPRYLGRRLKQLKRRSRDLSRKKRGSQRRAFAKWRLARVHARVRDCRREWSHQLSWKVVHDNQVICVEDLNVSGMLRNRHLSRALADGALAEFQRQLEYKALWYGRTFVRVGKWFPSTKRCSACGFVMEKLPLSARRWKCPECGVEHDRDVNAAINIRQEGLRILELPRGPREGRRVEGENPLAGRRVPLTSRRPGKRWSRGWARWRQDRGVAVGRQLSLHRRCLNPSIAPFPIPAHRTGLADFQHPAPRLVS
jgi:putative transposase